MDWFEQLMGFRETGYRETQQKMEVVDGRLRSKVNGKSYGIGTFELPSLQELRDRVAASGALPGRLRSSIVRGDVRKMHQMPEFAGALFQVASQFNMLEMVGPSVTPEDGVTRYSGDLTQGPACAIAAGAATIYRNYFAPVGDKIGQTAVRQLDGLADVGLAFEKALNKPVSSLWKMRNGYALCSSDGLAAISRHLDSLEPDELEALRGELRIGIHAGVEVTDGDAASTSQRPLVSQAFCSALPVQYSPVPAREWRAFASFVLDTAYEATMLAAVVNAQSAGSKTVLLTRLGGGAFSNDDEWIHSAMRRALDKAAGFDLNVRLVSYATPTAQLMSLVED
jgi:hypothetical protein